MLTAIFSKRVGAMVKEAAGKGMGWFSPHMAAASAAILERVPLIDFIIEVRDSRIPLSSAYEQLPHLPSSRHLILLNKMDLADRFQTERWMRHFEEQNCTCYAVNSHNKDEIKKFLNFLRARIKELKADRTDSTTTTIMLVGIPNVGKSAIANSMHQIGRIAATEKGKLKHATVSPLPGETKDISSFKIASHPSIYILDTPGVLSPEILDADIGSKLILTGAINGYLVGEHELARYFLAILNSCGEYRHWENLKPEADGGLCMDQQGKLLISSKPDKRRKRYSTDHTQDYIVKDVRRALFKTISCFKGNLNSEIEMAELIEAQFMALHEAFRVEGEHGQKRVAEKLLDLFRTGRLGHYTLDNLPQHSII